MEIGYPESFKQLLCNFDAGNVENYIGQGYPATEKNGAYILNGTKIPVFFSEDVTTLNAMQQQELIQKIKSAL